MSTMLSPGIYIREVDASAIVPSVSNNVAFLAGDFNAGPVNQPYVITNKQEYEEAFGYPTNDNFNLWFQGYKFFDYANQLIVTRGLVKEPSTPGTLIDNPVYLFETKGAVITGLDNTTSVDMYTLSQEIVATDINNGVPSVKFTTKETISSNPDDKTEIGNLLFINGVVDSNGFPIECEVTQIETLNTILPGSGGPLESDPDNNKVTFTVRPLSGDGSEFENAPVGASVYRHIMDGTVANRGVQFKINQSKFNFQFQLGDTLSFADIDESGYIFSMDSKFVDNPSGPVGNLSDVELSVNIEWYSDVGGSISGLVDAGVYLHSCSHKNSGTQALIRGDFDPSIGMYPLQSINPDKNIDTPVPSVSGASKINPNRLNYAYDIVENDSDFDYKLEKEELNSFQEDMKLKFYGRNPNTRDIEIAIGNWYDFQTDTNNSNLAIAFEQKVGADVEFTYLTSLFEYAPREGSKSDNSDDEIAIAIKHGDTIERWVVSMNPLSVDGNGRNNYIETVINENSKIAFCVDNTTISDVPASYLVCDRFGWGSNGYPEVSRLGIPMDNLKLIGGRSPKLSEGDIRDAYFTVEDRERYEIDVVIGNEQFPNVGIELADFRKDCIAYIGARYEDTVGKKAIDATNSILSYIKNGADGVNLTRTMFAADFANYFRIYDKYNKRYRWIDKMSQSTFSPVAKKLAA